MKGSDVTTCEKMTRDQARAVFDAAGLTYDVVTLESVQWLRTHINRHMRSSGLIQGSYRCRQRARVKQTRTGKFADVRCKAFYFDDREAASFNTDGFIGFAGWADDTNIQPVLAGFVDWVREVADLTPNANVTGLAPAQEIDK